MDNSFLEIVKEIKSINSTNDNLSYEVGTIQNTFPNILIEAYGIQLDKDDLIVNSQVMELTKDDAIKKGDEVLLLPFSEKFILLCRVVKL